MKKHIIFALITGINNSFTKLHNNILANFILNSTIELNVVIVNMLKLTNVNKYLLHTELIYNVKIFKTWIVQNKKCTIKNN